MESFLPLKSRRRRLLWSLHCFFCFAFVCFCAFYTYRRSLYQPLRIATEMTESLDASAISRTKTPSSGRGEMSEQTKIKTKPIRIVAEPAVILKASASSAREVPGTSTPSTTSQSPVLIDEVVADNSDLGDGEKLVLPPRINTSVTFIDDEGLPAELTCRSRASRTKLILLWTPFFGSWDYLMYPSFDTCKECTNCRVTNNRSLLLESDAVVFHSRDMSVADVPAVRLPNQRWIFYCLESPPYSDFPGMQFMHRMFNWTMTYRADSDIVTEYGSFRKVIPKRRLDMAALREVWQWKTKSVVWMSSHCPTDGGRDDYVAQLKKYIDVDEYGKCGTLSCPPDATDDCMRNFASTYKFFLAFENSVCKDYLTEKFYRSLKYDMVPVVFGGADYRRRAPPGSYIDALAFKSPKHLAYFLTGVGRDFALYGTYFEWRRDYEVRLDSRKDCALCSLLHKQDGRVSVYEDIRKWWVKDGKCRRWRQKG